MQAYGEDKHEHTMDDYVQKEEKEMYESMVESPEKPENTNELSE